MFKIRKNTFETNSSSTHSICISKSPITNIKGKHIHFGHGEYGWECNTEYDTASYLYTAIIDGNDKEYVDELLIKLKESLDRLGVTYTFDEIEPIIYSGGNSYYKFKKHDGYVDHACECDNLIDALLENDDLLARFLFGDSVIYTGSDNSGDEDSMCWVADNEYHPQRNNEKYEYYFKEN